MPMLCVMCSENIPDRGILVSEINNSFWCTNKFCSPLFYQNPQPFSFNFVYNHDGEPSISLFPNPTDENATTYISLSLLEGQEVLVVLRDIAGNEVCSKVVIASSNNKIVAIDQDGKLAKGTYLVTASSANKLYGKKLIVK